jgi:putative nucleotidyltransferase with HDIG domain
MNNWVKSIGIRFRKFFLLVEKSLKSKAGFRGTRIVLLFMVLLLLNIFTPRKSVDVSNLGGPKEGDIAPENVIAPFTFFITKPQSELESDQEAAGSAVLPVFDLDEKKEEEVLRKIKQFFKDVEKIAKNKEMPEEEKIERVQSLSGGGLTAATIFRLLSESASKDKNGDISKTLQNLLKEVFRKGVIRNKLAYRPKLRGVIIRLEDVETPKGPGEIYDRSEAILKIREEGARLYSGDPEKVETLVELASAFLEENLHYNEIETKKRQTRARDGVSQTKGTVLKGEMIVRAHDPVTKEVVDKLRSLREAKGNDKPRPQKFLSHLGRNGIFLLLIFFFGLYLEVSKPEMWKRFSSLLLLSLITCAVIGLSSLVLFLSPSGEYKEAYLFLFPVPFAVTLVAILLGREIGVALTVLLSLLLGIYTDLRFVGSLVALAGGLAGVASVKGLIHRSQFYKTFLFIITGQILAILSLDFLRLKPPTVIRIDVLFGLINGFFSTLLLIGLLPFFERIFKITTNLTLLELSDMNRPLLRKLAVQAPGTYHHSLVLGSLSEAAAKSIGANPLLARVSSYYHDIGKMKKPQYFIENQSGIKNPHDEITPEMSSLVVSSHIKEGVDMAKEAGLPQRIIDVIQEHQGTTLMKFFHEKAKSKNSGKNVDESQFRYPGPKPSTQESAIIMLADTIEATCRSLENPTPTRLKEAIQESLERRLRDGQLDSCNLTLAQLRKIGDAFFPVLVGIFHPRIEYPADTQNPPRSTAQPTTSQEEKPNAKG